MRLNIIIKNLMVHILKEILTKFRIRSQTCKLNLKHLIKTLNICRFAV